MKGLPNALPPMQVQRAKHLPSHFNLGLRANDNAGYLGKKQPFHSNKHTLHNHCEILGVHTVRPPHRTIYK